MPTGSACLDPRAGHLPVERRVRPVAASTVLREVLQRPSSGRVLAVFPTAVYVQVGDGAGADVVALVASDGLRLPIAAVLAAASGSAPFAGHRSGDPVAVLDGELHVGPVRYVAGRWWSPRRARPGRPDETAVRELGAALTATAPAHVLSVERLLSAASTGLRTALRREDAAAASAAADTVLGLGPGLTPSGDDLLAGLLVTCHALQAPSASAALGRHVTDRAGGCTTALSAALLRCAATGAAAPPLIGLVDAVAGRRPLAAAVRDLLAVGSTSGHDTARGVLLAAEVLLDRTTPTQEDS